MKLICWLQTFPIITLRDQLQCALCLGDTHSK
jgi:hypothetical protein